MINIPFLLGFISSVKEAASQRKETVDRGHDEQEECAGGPGDALRLHGRTPRSQPLTPGAHYCGVTRLGCDQRCRPDQPPGADVGALSKHRREEAARAPRHGGPDPGGGEGQQAHHEARGGDVYIYEGLE